MQHKRLSGIERDIILAYLSTEHIILTIVPYEQTTEAESVRLETGCDGVSVSTQGLISIKQTAHEIAKFSRQAITVFFYFRKLGLSFRSRVMPESGGFTITVPPEISRIAPEQSETSKHLTVTMLSSSAGKLQSNISCITDDRYPLFKFETWQNFSKANSELCIKYIEQFAGLTMTKLSAHVFAALKKSGRLLYKPDGALPQQNPFSIDVCVLAHEWDHANLHHVLSSIKKLPFNLYMPLNEETLLAGAVSKSIFSRNGALTQGAIEQLLCTVAVCNYLSIPNGFASVEDRIEPLTIAFISDRVIVLGGAAESFPLADGHEYDIQFNCAVPAGVRLIHTSCVVSNIYDSSENKKSAAVCTYVGLKAEDRRFLFEKLYGTVFTRQP